MICKIGRSLLVALVLGAAATSAFASGCYPVLISQPDFDDGHTAPELAENGAYFLTSDGYPVLRDSRGDWLYMVNGTPMVLMPYGDGYVWTPAAGPVVTLGHVVSVSSPAVQTRQMDPRVEPSWYSYSVPQKP